MSGSPAVLHYHPTLGQAVNVEELPGGAVAGTFRVGEGCVRLVRGPGASWGEPPPLLAGEPPAQLESPLAAFDPPLAELVAAASTRKARGAQAQTRRVLGMLRDAGAEPVRDAATGQRFALMRVGARVEALNADELADHGIRLAVEVGDVPSSSSARDATKALFAGEAREARVFVRLGSTPDGGRLAVDLGDDSGRAVVVDAAGWSIVPAPPVAFRRTAATLPMVTPAAGRPEDLVALVGLLGLEGDAAVLVVAWGLGALALAGPFPVLMLTGPAGAGKSTTASLIVDLLDPQRGAGSPLPQDDRELAVGAEGSRVLFYDNASEVSQRSADALARTATGGGQRLRALYSDRASAIFQTQAPVIVTSVPALVDRSDLADRALVVELPARCESLTLRELRAAFDVLAPRALGALLSAAAAALANRDRIEPPRDLRMADFALWICAAAAGGALPFTADEFLDAYRRNRRSVAREVAGGDLLAATLAALVPKPGDVWRGTPAELLAALTVRAGVEQLPPRARHDWPSSPTALGRRFSRLEHVLRREGILISRGRSESRHIEVERVALDGDEEAAQ